MSNYFVKETGQICEKSSCTACGACENACPMRAINMEYDEDGFLYPVVNGDLCINCGKCVRSCQGVQNIEFYDEPKSYAMWANKEIRRESSSGGFFSVISKYVIEKNGVVFGAVYTDDFQNVYITKAETIDEISPMRKSKYVFCETRDSFSLAKEYLDNQRLVVYTGTPCEIEGLKLFLGRDYNNLITVDFVCHAANSVTAFQSWLQEFTGGREIEKLNFRDKNEYGWSTPAVAYLKDGTVIKQSYDSCYWYKGFLEGVINRENCSKCKFAQSKRVADFTMADAWGISTINKDFNDGNGTSLLLVNSPKATVILDDIKADMELCEEIPLDTIRKFNGNLNYPQKQHKARKFFFSHLKKDGYHRALWYGRAMRWDVGLVGWWFASNYGSALTYYGLANFLEANNKSVIFIPVPMLSGEPWDKGTKSVREFISTYYKIANDRDIYHMKEFNHFCDAFVLGSDQMWTDSTTRLVGYSFFLDFADANTKKVACATSFGAGRFTNDLKMKCTARDYLKRFNDVSVREQSGVEVCKDVFDVDATQIIDPIFWCDNSAYNVLADKAVIEELPKKYLLCYILDPNEEKEQLVKRIAQEKDLEIINILDLREFEHVKKHWNIGKTLENVSIEMFVKAFRDCSYVFTDSHHGTCMAIKYQKDYIAIGNRKRGLDRFMTIGNLLGLSDRVVTLPVSAEEILDKADIDYIEVERKLNYEVHRGQQWLLNALNKDNPSQEETIYTLLRRIEALEKKVEH